MTLIYRLARYLVSLIGLGLAVTLFGAGSAQAATQPYNIYRGPNVSSYVVLSFDDCPKSYSAFKSTVLAAEKLNIALVLFPTGNCIKSGKFDPAYARKHGHYVFNHSVSHPDLTTLSTSKIKAQLSKPGVVTNYGRPPYGAINAKVRAAYGYGTSTPTTGEASPARPS